MLVTTPRIPYAIYVLKVPPTCLQAFPVPATLSVQKQLLPWVGIKARVGIKAIIDAIRIWNTFIVLEVLLLLGRLWSRA